MDAGHSSTLDELLGSDLAYDPTTSEGLTNHLPMALVAKQRLGATDNELRRFAHQYSRRLIPLSESRHKLTAKSWITAIGQRDAATELRDYFARQVAETGTDRALRSHLPELMPGLGGAGFHGVIRLAYAVEARSATQIAAGLAYLAQVANPLRPLAKVEASSDSPEEILEAASHSGEWRDAPRAELIDDEMRIVASKPAFGALVSQLAIDGSTQHHLESCALHIYASTDNFTALHGVTGMSALSILRPLFDDTLLLDQYAFQALAAAYLSVGAPSFWSVERYDEFVGVSSSDASAIEAAGAQTDDAHEAKIVYTALQEYESTANPLYLAVASRATGIVGNERRC